MTRLGEVLDEEIVGMRAEEVTEAVAHDVAGLARLKKRCIGKRKDYVVWYTLASSS